MTGPADSNGAGQPISALLNGFAVLRGSSEAKGDMILLESRGYVRTQRR